VDVVELIYLILVSSFFEVFLSLISFFCLAGQSDTSPRPGAFANPAGTASSFSATSSASSGF